MGALAQGLAFGALKPLMTPAHLLALAGLGLLLARPPSRTLLFAMFVLALAVGLIAIAAAVGATPARNVLLACAAIAGAMVAIALPAPRVIVAVVAAATGIALGLDSPPETISIAVGNAMLAGTWLGACLLVAVVAVCACRLAGAWQQIALRVFGSWIAASAILSLAFRVLR